MTVLETERTRLRELEPDDAAFILALLNEPSFLRHIGDRGVRTIDEARDYIRTGPADSYRRHGFGLYLVARKHDDEPMGICGLLKRDTLDDVDIGFAFRPEFWRQGYGRETAAAVLAHARSALGLERVVAITSAGNRASIQLLEKLGLRFERLVRLEPDADEVRLFGTPSSWSEVSDGA